MRFVQIPGRALLRIDVGSEIPDVKGAIVWAQPVRGSTPEEVAEFVRRVKAAGAVRVTANPLEFVDAAFPERVHDKPAKANATVRGIIEEMLKMVKEQPGEVREIVERALAEAGF